MPNYYNMKRILIKYLIISVLLVGAFGVANSQPRAEMIQKIELVNKDTTFCTDNNTILHNEEKHLYFEFSNIEEEFLLRIYPGQRFKNHTFDIISTSDYEVTDSVFKIEDKFYQTKIVFKRIIDNPRLSLKVSAKDENRRVMISEIPLFPIAVMECDFASIPDEVFVGEEASLEIFSNLPQNIVLDNKWNRKSNYNYRILRRTNKVFTSIVATRTGNINIDFYVELKRPVRNSDGELVYSYGPLPIRLNVKQSRLAFLNLERSEIMFTEESRSSGIEIQMDYHSALKMQTTYRIEAQEKPGGALIAEIFTKSRLANNKVVCVLRTYNYHDQSDGFLYLKEGDIARFVTNFSIIPLPDIENIRIMREGTSWQSSSTVYPGEEVFIRLEGRSLQKASFSIEGLIVDSGDTLVNRDDVIEFRARIPLDIRRKYLQIMDNNKPTGKQLTVSEYNNFRPFDYIIIDYGKGEKFISDITGPEFYPATIRDIIISFDNDRIDEDKLHGVQKFDLSVRVTGSRNEVFEVLNLNNISVVPGTNSPRYAFYDKRHAVNRISLNQHLRRNTYDLDDWVKFQLVFTPAGGQQTGKDDVKTIDIIVQKKYKFDIDVSFPAGLLTKKFDGDSDFGNLSGISMAMIAQFSFYQKDKIARFKPYKIGAGFIAINALNFSETAYRDVGVVIMGSLYPTTRDSRMTFPLYFGGGYLLDEAQFFVLIGPGIRVRF